MGGLGLAMAKCPEEIGLSAERLERIRTTLRQDVERRLVPGAVMLIARGGRIGFAEAIGFRDRDAGAPMTLDAIFHIASMTKPITSVAAMILAEEGRLQIAAPVADYLPEFAGRTVGVERVRARHPEQQAPLCGRSALPLDRAQCSRRETSFRERGACRDDAHAASAAAIASCSLQAAPAAIAAWHSSGVIAQWRRSTSLLRIAMAILERPA